MYACGMQDSIVVLQHLSPCSKDVARKAGTIIFYTDCMQALLDRPKITCHRQAGIDAVTCHVQSRAVP